MANQYSRPSEYNAVVAPVDLNLLQQSLATKQKQIDTGYSIVQDELDKYNQFDIYRPEDREYLKQKLDEKVKGLNQMSGIDLSNVQSIYKIKAMAGDLANDEKIVNARMSTARIRKEDQVADAVATNPKLIKYNDEGNQAWYNQAKRDYLEGKTDSFNEKFLLNTTTEKFKEAFKTLTPKQWQELADHNYTIINNTTKTLEDLKQEAIGLANTDSSVAKQLQIAYWYNTQKGIKISPKDILNSEQDIILLRQTAYKNQMTDLITEAKNYATSDKYTPEQKKEIEILAKQRIDSIKTNQDQIQKSLDKITNLKKKLYTGVDLNTDEEYQSHIRNKFNEDYVSAIASPFVIDKQERKANTGYIAMQRNFEFGEKMKFEMQKQKDLNDYRANDLGLKKLAIDSKNGLVNGQPQQAEGTYQDFPTVAPENESPTEANTRVEGIVLNNVKASQQKLSGAISGLSQSMIQSSNLPAETRGRIADLTEEQLRKLKPGDLGLSTADINIVHSALSTIDNIMKSDVPLIPDNYKQFMGQIERVKDAQIEANYYSKWNPEQDAKVALTPKEYEEYTKLSTDKTQYIPTPGGLAVITSGRIERDSKRKAELDKKIEVRKAERTAKFNTRTSVIKKDIPEEGENPVAKERSANAIFSLNHKNSIYRPVIKRLIQDQGVTKEYFAPDTYAVGGNIQGKGTANQKWIGNSQYTEEFEEANLDKTEILQIDNNGKIKVQLKNEKGENIGTPVYVDGSNDSAHLGFLKKAGMEFSPIGGLNTNEIIKEQRGAYNGDKLIQYSLSTLDPESKLNIPYVILSDKNSIYFEFDINGRKIKTPKYDGNSPINDLNQVKQFMKQAIAVNKQKAQGDLNVLYKLMIESIEKIPQNQ